MSKVNLQSGVSDPAATASVTPDPAALPDVSGQPTGEADPAADAAGAKTARQLEVEAQGDITRARLDRFAEAGAGTADPFSRPPARGPWWGASWPQSYGRADGREVERSDGDDPAAEGEIYWFPDGRGGRSVGAVFEPPQRSDRPAEVPRTLAAAAVDYLSGASDGQDLPPEIRRALDQVLDAVGREAAREFIERGGERAAGFVERLISQALRAPDPAPGSLASGSLAPGSGAPDGAATRQAVDELIHVIRVGQFFARLEPAGGDPARRAEGLVWHVLSDKGAAPGAANAAELLRDLRSGAILAPRESGGPFPLSGRARAVSEMLGLTRTLEAMIVASVREATGEGVGARPAEAGPALPGRAGRNEIPSFVLRHDGLLTDAGGRPLQAADGTPVKLGELLWLSTAGGLLGAAAESRVLTAQISPLLVYGFDALYAVIGFDGRSLSPPRYWGLQVEVNGSAPEWTYGQPPLSEGWARALIERLKDAAAAELNLLGETLEEALADGRLEFAVVRGTVENGEAVPTSFQLADSHARPAAALYPPTLLHIYS